MSKKVYFNFFEYNTIIDSMVDFFEIEKEEINRFMDFVNYEKLDAEEAERQFIAKFKINNDLLDFDNCYIRVKHISTSYDKLECIKKYGMRDLIFLLTEDTLLKRFLQNYNLQINYSEKYIDIDGTKYYIKDYNTCDKDEFSYPYRRNMSNIYHKLYYFRGEIEAFYKATEKAMYNYSTILRCPEIISNLDQFLKHINKNIHLEFDWCNKYNSIPYLIEFDLPVSKLIDKPSLLIKCFLSLDDCDELTETIKYGVKINFKDVNIKRI